MWSRRNKEQSALRKNVLDTFLKQLMENTLYSLDTSNEPVVHFLFRDGGKVYGIQVTSAIPKKTRTVKQSTLQDFFKEFGLDSESFVFCFIPPPAYADSYEIDLQGFPQVKKMIWKLPKTYKKSRW